MNSLNADVEYGTFELPKRAGRAAYGKYTLEIKRFLAQDKTMGKLVFEDIKTAVTAANSLVIARKRMRFPVVIKRDKNLVYLIKNEG